jgi:hypothetical protein
MLIFNQITKHARNYGNKNLLNELKNRIFARPMKGLPICYGYENSFF